MNESCTEATRDSTLPIWTVLITTTHQQFALISGPHPPASLGLAASPQLGSAAANGAHRRSAPAPPFPAPLVPHSQSALSAANFDATTKSWEKSPWNTTSQSQHRSAQRALARMDGIGWCTCTGHFSGGPALYGRALPRTVSFQHAGLSWSCPCV